jgi:hypothetical protein
MAFTKVNIAIAALVEETALTTVDKLVAFLAEKIELDDDMQGMFTEFKASISAQAKEDAKGAKKAGKKADKKGAEPKAKRPPSEYNMYISRKMAELKAAGYTGNLMKGAIEAWNAEKATAAPAPVADAVAEGETSETAETVAEAPQEEKEEKPKKERKPRVPKQKKQEATTSDSAEDTE